MESILAVVLNKKKERILKMQMGLRLAAIPYQILLGAIDSVQDAPIPSACTC